MLLVALVIANIVAIPGFLSSSGYLALLVAGLAPIAIAAIASTPSILSGGGGVDISIGPLVGFINIVLTVVLIPHGLGAPWIAIPILLALGTLVGAIQRRRGGPAQVPAGHRDGLRLLHPQRREP